MNNISRVVFCLLAVVLLPLKSLAQVSVQANMDSIQILIGEQANMYVEVVAQKGASIVWPKLQPKSYLVPGVEIVDVADADTSLLDNNLVKVTRKVTLTSFDNKLYPIPGIKVKVNGKQYVANNLALKVLTVDVDTVHPNQFYPPKDVQDNPFSWADWTGIIWVGVLLWLIMVALCYLLVRLKQNKPIITHIRIVKRIPPHKKALNAIEKIKAERMQTSEDQKTYYTQLTDTLRQYIQERFGFSAKEMTSAEIIDHLQTNGDQTMIAELRELFATADLVKFAKHSTLINENDLNLVNAVNFIDKTKLEGQPTEERIVPQLSENEQKQRSVRITIKGLLYALSALAILAIAYLAYSLYILLN